MERQIARTDRQTAVSTSYIHQASLSLNVRHRKAQYCRLIPELFRGTESWQSALLSSKMFTGRVGSGRIRSDVVARSFFRTVLYITKIKMVRR